MIGIGIALCRLLLRLYPRSMRERYGAGMEAAYRRMIERRDSRSGRVFAVLRGLLDVAIGAVRERWKGDLSASGVEVQKRYRGGRETMGGWVRDLRYAFRALGKAPVFTLIAAGSLALGIGANVAVFSVANAVLFRPLPGIENHERVVDLGRTTRGSGFDTFAFPDFRDIREEVDALVDASAVSFSLLSISQGAEGLRAVGFGVEPSYFSVLGTRPAMGRFFAEHEGVGGSDDALVVISHRWWQERLGADPDVLGRTLYLNRVPFTVIGVTEPEFRGHLIAAQPEVFYSLGQYEKVGTMSGEVFDRRNTSWHTGVGLLATGVDIDGLKTQLSAIGERLADAYPETNEFRSFTAMPLGPVPGAGRGGVRLFVTVLIGMVGLILLVTCTNVAGMFLARATARRHEMAIRAALGSGRSRLIQQLTVETLLIFVLGGGLGLLLATWAVGLVRPDMLPVPIPINFDIGIDRRVVLFTVLTTLGTGLLFGLLPAVRSTKVGLASGLTSAARGGDRVGSRLRTAFASAQVGFSLILLLAAGLFVRSLQRASEVDVGFDPEGAYVTRIDLAMEGYDTEEARHMQSALLERLRSQGWVASASLSTDLPLDLARSNTIVTPEGWSGEGRDGRLGADFNRVSDGYFETLGLHLVQGRTLARADDESAPKVAVVSRSFAENAWPDEDPLGRSFNLGVEGGDWQVVGIVEDAKNQFVMEEPAPHIYFPLPQFFGSAVHVAVRTNVPAAGAVGSLRSALLEQDPNISMGSIDSLERVTSLGILPQRIAAALTSALGVLALILSGLGIYGVVSFSVGRRQREIGVRMALGAGRGQVVLRFLRAGFMLAFPGLVLGGAASLAVGPLLRSLLLDLSPYDPIALGGVSMLLLGMVLLAAWIPARRAAGVDPSISLRQE